MRGVWFSPTTEIQCPVGALVSPLGPWRGPRAVDLIGMWSLNMPKTFKGYSLDSSKEAHF